MHLIENQKCILSELETASLESLPKLVLASKPTMYILDYYFSSAFMDLLGTAVLSQLASKLVL